MESASTAVFCSCRLNLEFGIAKSEIPFHQMPSFLTLFHSSAHPPHHLGADVILFLAIACLATSWHNGINKTFYYSSILGFSLFG
jgi:hypothetical protein